MSVFANIQRLLDTQLKTLPSSPFISWPNAETRPGNAALTQYVKPTLILGKSELNTLSGADRIPGIYQIDVYGQLNRGVRQVYMLADEIKEYFTTTRNLVQGETNVKILTVDLRPSEDRGTNNKTDAWFKIIVDINFICFNN